MGKEHISTMAQAVKGYYSAAKQTAAQIEKNNSRYRADIAEGENEKARQQLQQAKWEAEAAVREAQEAGRADAEKWGDLRGSDLTDDAKLLQMDISPAQFASLVERYRSNGTMSALLFQYGQRKNDEAAKNGAVGLGQYDVSSITTVEKKAGVYDRFAVSALDLISRVDQVDTFGGGIDSPMLQTSIESFGEPSAFTQALFDLL
jgi:hypothetical protein